MQEVKEWLEDYNQRLQAKRGLSLKKHQWDGIIDLVTRLNPIYERWVKMLEEKPTETEPKYRKDNWQKDVNLIREEMGYLIAWNMGLGKTAVALIALEMLHKFFPVIFEDRIPAIAIVPNTLKGTWKKEFSRWLIDRNLTDIVIIPSDKSDAYVWTTMARVLKPFLIITSYDTNRIRNEALRELRYGVLIMDEVHYIKNHEAQRTKSIYWLDANLKIGLAGTPITNHPNDWHSSLVALQGTTVISKNIKGEEFPLRRSQTWGSYANFLNEYCIIGGMYNQVKGGKNLSTRGCRLCQMGCARGCRKIAYSRLACNDCTDPIPLACRVCLHPLHPRAKHYVMNRLSGDEDGLEPFRLIERNHDLTELQLRYYNKIKEGLVEWMEQEREGFGWQKGMMNVSNILAQLTYFLEVCVDLRQLAYSIKNKSGGDNVIAFSGLTGSSILAKATEKDMSGKLAELKEMFEEDIDIAGEDKLLIFTRFAITAHLLQEDLKKYHPLVIDGQANAKKQTDNIVDAFQNDSKHRILIGTSAAFEGLTLTAANWVVLYGVPDWSPLRILQAIKRAHRIGQTKPVTVVKLLASETIEEKIQEKLAEKQADFDSAVDGNTVSRMSTFLSNKEEVLSLV